jgi:hypothetical protein
VFENSVGLSFSSSIFWGVVEEEDEDEDEEEREDDSRTMVFKTRS